MLNQFLTINPNERSLTYNRLEKNEKIKKDQKKEEK